ncbi:cupin domain-containing protein [uncultured Roseobacter sp.]|uniref:cupin domain-containing protein n=1 Tax=uncultured Roseobacter sp. TaxID=114847 RepID=UPI00262474F5|nr:cupin domain-containing protein [uncultured Roseobacter sp.]
MIDPKVTNRTRAPYYPWGAGCDGWRLLDKAELSVIEERMPPGTSEERHFHRHALQLFYVLTGQLTIEVKEDVHVLGPGDALPVLPPSPHQVRNEGAAEVRFLVISAPPTTNDRQVQ